MSRYIALIFGMSLGLALPASSQTQITTGVIQGTVSDATGGVVPGATVEIRNTATNFLRSLTSGPDGRFVGLQLPPGPYIVTVSLWRASRHTCRKASRSPSGSRLP